MATRVLDSHALLTFFQDEPGAEEVEKLLARAEADSHKLLLSVVNWGEVYYNTMRKVSQPAAEEIAREIAGLPIELVPVGIDLELVRCAAAYKAEGSWPTQTHLPRRWRRCATRNWSPATRISNKSKMRSGFAG